MYDQSRAVVAGVKVVASNKETGATHTAVANESGLYIFATLDPGHYELTAEYPGFKKVRVTNIELKIGDSMSRELVLQPGDVTESVTVVGEAALVNTATAKIGSVVGNRQAVDLPLNGRNAMMLFYLQAGTNPLDRLGSQQQNGSVDGLAPHTSSIKVEGIMASNGGYDYAPSYPGTPVPQEAVGEYRVTTSGDSSEAGRGSGAQVKVAIRSGTNQFHGSVFEFNRNTRYNANDFFNNRSGTPRPVLLRNQFGFAVGGPIRKNKTFFFTTAEWQRQVAASVENRTVYTGPLRDGIFRYYRRGATSGALVDGAGNPKVVAADIGTINLLTADPTRLGADTVFLPKILKQMPLPNNFDLGDGFNTGGYRYNSPNTDNYYTYLFKIDHELTPNHRLAGSYSHWSEDAPQARMYNGISPEGFHELRQGGSLRVISLFTSHLTNELSVGANRRTSLRPITNPDQLTPSGNIQLEGLGTGSGLTGGNNGNIHVVRSFQRNPSVNEGFQNISTWIRGNHTVTFGGEYWYQTLNRKVGTSEYPVVRTTATANPPSLPALTDLNTTDRSRAQQLLNDLTGSIGSITQTFYLTSREGFIPYVNTYEQLRKREGAANVHDIWRLKPGLSVNIGLRWEYMPPVYIANGVYSYPVGGVGGALGIQGPTHQPTAWNFEPGGGDGVMRTDHNNFAPSIGFVWDPFKNGKTAISGAYRIAYDRFMIVTGDFSNYNYGANTTIVLNPLIRLSDPKVYGQVLPIATPTPFAPLANERQSRAYVSDYNLATPYTQLWTFTIEREVRKDWKLSASYVGNHAAGMWRALNVNQVEVKNNGFLDAFKIAQQNLAANGNPLTGQNLGPLSALFRLVPSSQNALITQGQAGALANYIDTTTLTTGKRGGLLGLAGLPDTFFRFNPQVDNLNVIGNNGHSTWDGLKVMLTKRLSSGFFMQFNYTLGKGFTDSVPQQSLADDYRDNSNFRLDKALSPIDSTHVVQINGIYELPFGRGKPFFTGANGWKQALAGGWQFNSLFNLATGRPLVITTGRLTLNQGQAATPDFSGDFSNLSTVNRGGAQVTLVTPEQARAFSNPAAGSPGGLPLQSFHGPRFTNLDASLFKMVKLPFLGESGALQFRVEAFNLLNNPSFQPPPAANLSINSGSFGVITAAYPARVGQLAAKITF